MVEIKSQRAKKLLEAPRALISVNPSVMRKYPADELNVWVQVERQQQIVKKLSFGGELLDYERVLLEAVAALIAGRSISVLENLSLRECEAFLRDRNSELSLEQLPPSDEARFKRFFSWLRLLPSSDEVREYHYESEKGPFSKLKLVDKIRELKAFLNSPEVKSLYTGVLAPELVDVEELTVFIQVPYQTERERALFEELHILGVSTFQEENLNFIPDA